MRRWVWLWSVLLLLVGAHFAYWRLAAGQLRAGYAAWAAAERAAGSTVSNGQPELGGWPLAATLTVPELFIAGAPSSPLGGLAGDLAWSTDHLVLRVALLAPGVLEVQSTGLQRLRFGDGPEFPYTADELEIDIPLAAGTSPSTADLLARGLRIGLPVASAAPMGTAGGRGGEAVSHGSNEAGAAESDLLAGVTIGLLKGHLELKPSAGQSPPVTGFLLAAEAIGLPTRALPAVTDALGTRLSSLSIEGSLAGSPPPLADPAARVRAWRDAGGALEIGRLALGWGPLGLSLTAHLTLDAELQPTGTGTVRIINFDRTLDALAASHAIGAQAALAGKALLGLIAQPAGASDAVNLPVALADRMLSVRKVPLLRLPALEWN